MKRYIYITFLICFSIFTFSIALAEEQKSPTETYLDELQAQGKQRVIVSFKDDAEVDTSLVDKYGGKLIRVFKTIKALVCEIPQENIELLQGEESVKSVSPDAIIKSQPEGTACSSEHLAQYLQFKKDYLKKIREEYIEAVRQANREYIKFIQQELSKRRRTLTCYATLLNYYRARRLTNSSIYKYYLSEYNKKLKEYYNVFKEALFIYHETLIAAKNNYTAAAAIWYAKATDYMTFLYSGAVTPKWNNLEDGLNSQPAWDRYNLDGDGIKIAFLDTAINYELPDLDGNYLGGINIMTEEPDPLPYIDPDPWPNDDSEDHGTFVASIAVGEGDSLVVGPAYNAKYYGVKVLDETGVGLVSDFISGIEWASEDPHKADIISMSFCVYDEDYPGNIWWPPTREEFRDACNVAYSAGIILIGASGNRSYDHSGYPAGFENVISVGAHAENQSIPGFSNGGVDVVAPGYDVDILHPKNLLYWGNGTSFAAPQAAALIALQLQYARQNNIQPTNGYLWEVMKHSAIDLGLNTTYQGNGKVWAADTTGNPGTGDGSIDCIAQKWPLSYDITYDNYLWLDGNGYPVYYIGTFMYYDVALTNNTNTVGTYTADIENLDVTTTQAYYIDNDEATLPGAAAVEAFTRRYEDPEVMSPAEQLPLSDSYFLPWTMNPGVDRIILDLEFEFANDTNNRLIKVTYPYASLWCPPPALNDGFPVSE